jgi:hypothetical protein
MNIRQFLKTYNTKANLNQFAASCIIADQIHNIEMGFDPILTKEYRMLMNRFTRKINPRHAYDLYQDIKANGLQSHISIYKDGTIADGSHRFGSLLYLHTQDILPEIKFKTKLDLQSLPDYLDQDLTYFLDKIGFDELDMVKIISRMQYYLNYGHNQDQSGPITPSL